MCKYYRFIFIVTIVLLACEEQIDLSIETFEERPIIEANFEINRDSSYTRAIVRLRKSTTFFEEEYNAVEQATVSITNTNNDSIFIFDPISSGFYSTNNFTLKEDILYELQVEIDGEVYLGRASSVNNVPIENVSYLGDILFENEEYAELNISFKDNENENNFYIFEIDYNNPRTLEDEFFNGQEFNFLAYKRKIEIFDNDIIVRSYGIDKNYFNYLEKLTELGEPRFTGPFSTAPPNLRGNMINLTNPTNFAFGYFQISVVYEKRVDVISNNTSSVILQ